MSIPNEAIDAACAAFFQGLPYIHPESKADMQRALEAAAPYMLGGGERKTTILRLNESGANWEEL